MSEESFAYSTGGETRKVGLKGAATRDHIISTTLRLLNDTRLKDLRVADIAREAKTSKGTFYTYFKDVSDVVLAALLETRQITPEIIALFKQDWTKDSAPDLARRFIELYVDNWQRHKTLFRIRNLAAEEGDGRFIERRREAVQPLLAVISALVQKRQESGELPAALLPIAVAGTIAAMVERISAVWGLYFYDKSSDSAHYGFRQISNSDILEAAAYIVATTLAPK